MTTTATDTATDTATEMVTGQLSPVRRRQLLALHAELARGAELPTPLIQRFSEEPVIALDRRRGAWIVVPAERDPLRSRRGQHAIPTQQRNALKRLAGSAVRFDRIVIAHELDPNGPVRELLPSLAQEPQICSDVVARALIGPLPPHPGTSRAVRILDAVVRGGSSAVGGIGTLVGDVARDPIVFGVIGHPVIVEHGQFALWYPLTAWKW